MFRHFEDLVGDSILMKLDQNLTDGGIGLRQIMIRYGDFCAGILATGGLRWSGKSRGQLPFERSDGSRS